VVRGPLWLDFLIRKVCFDKDRSALSLRRKPSENRVTRWYRSLCHAGAGRVFRDVAQGFQRLDYRHLHKDLQSMTVCASLPNPRKSCSGGP
jgi:hypothetical protein